MQRDVAEEARAHRLQLVQALAAQHDQAHRARVVVRRVEGPQRLAQIDLGGFGSVRLGLELGLP